jgi:hypothetical protein
MTICRMQRRLDCSPAPSSSCCSALHPSGQQPAPRMVLSIFLIFLATGLCHRGWQNWRRAISWSMRPRTLVVRVEAGEALPRQDAPGPLARRHVPTNVAVAEFPLQNDAKPVAEKVEVGRAAWKSRVDDVDSIRLDIVLQTRSRFLTGAAARYQKCQEDCCCAAHESPSEWSRPDVGLALSLAQRKRRRRDGRRMNVHLKPIHSLRADHAGTRNPKAHWCDPQRLAAGASTGAHTARNRQGNPEGFARRGPQEHPTHPWHPLEHVT